MNLDSDDVTLLAYALEYGCNDDMYPRINKILEKIENGLHIDAEMGSKLYEYGHVMGWSKKDKE
jgi:hypothetical protein